MKLVMPSNHLILCHPLLHLPSIFPSLRDFSHESVLHIRWPKYWSFGFSISPSNEYSGLISFRMDWLDLLAVQGTLKSLLQHHSSKSINSSVLSFLYRLAVTSIHDYGKKHHFDFLICCLGLVITFVPRSKRLLISWLQSPSAVILEPQKIKNAFPLI